MAEADAQQRPAVVDDGSREPDRAAEPCRIAGPGRQDEPVDVGGEGVGRRDRVREDPDPGAAPPHREDDVRLEAV